ncbi:hypothetical protein B566_EDAN016422, partial [Ephemera danica]
SPICITRRGQITVYPGIHTHWQRSCEGGDYINAVYVDGVTSRNSYIVTQLPLPEHGGAMARTRRIEGVAVHECFRQAKYKQKIVRNHDCGVTQRRHGQKQGGTTRNSSVNTQRLAREQRICTTT